MDGAANGAIEAFFAELLELPRRDVSIRSGLSSRRKEVLIVLRTDQEVIVAKLIAAAARGLKGS